MKLFINVFFFFKINLVKVVILKYIFFDGFELDRLIEYGNIVVVLVIVLMFLVDLLKVWMLLLDVV